jgi:hypothetical protein
MKYMAEPLGHELQTLYGRLVTQLKDANVQAAGYRVTPQAGGPSGGVAANRADAPISQRGDLGPRTQSDASAVGAHANDSGAVYASLSSRQISHTLLREFLSTGGGEQASQALPLSYYAEIDRELASLERQASGMGDIEPHAQLPEGYREMSVIARPQRAVGVQSTLDKEVWGEYAHSHERSLVRTRLRRDAKRVAQVLGLELVRKVVNQVAQDPRLLAPVREAIVALEPSLLRLAMVDPRFFSDEKHPGRWMMERVAQRSFKYNDEFSTEFAAFFENVTQCFTGLNDSEIANVQPFEQAISTLESAWAEQDAHDASQRNDAVDAMKFAELRQSEADRIAWELSARPDLIGVPSVVQDFIFGPWALVIANARLADRDGQIDPRGYREVITDLVWSVKPEVTLKQPAQLFARVPPLVAKLREGLASLGQDPEESEPFFQALMKLHNPVLKLRRAKSRRDARESGVAPLGAVDEQAAPLLPEAASTVVKGQPWMSPKELDAAGFEETLPSDMAPLEADSEISAAAPLAPVTAEPAAPQPERKRKRETTHLPADPETILANVREGDWFDLYSKRKWLRAQLIWASTKGTLFMFVSHGGQPHSMTKRICERLIRERVLRPVRMHGVVARALDVLKEEEAPA